MKLIELTYTFRDDNGQDLTVVFGRSDATTDDDIPKTIWDVRIMDEPDTEECDTDDVWAAGPLEQERLPTAEDALPFLA